MLKDAGNAIDLNTLFKNAEEKFQTAFKAIGSTWDNMMLSAQVTDTKFRFAEYTKDIAKE